MITWVEGVSVHGWGDGACRACFLYFDVSSGHTCAHGNFKDCEQLIGVMRLHIQGDGTDNKMLSLMPNFIVLWWLYITILVVI